MPFCDSFCVHQVRNAVRYCHPLLSAVCTSALCESAVSPSFSRQRFRSASLSAFLWLSRLLCCRRAFSLSSCLRLDSRPFLLLTCQRNTPLLVTTHTASMNTLPNQTTAPWLFCYEDIPSSEQNKVDIGTSLATANVLIISTKTTGDKNCTI